MLQLPAKHGGPGRTASRTGLDRTRHWASARLPWLCSLPASAVHCPPLGMGSHGLCPNCLFSPPLCRTTLTVASQDWKGRFNSTILIPLSPKAEPKQATNMWKSADGAPGPANLPLAANAICSHRSTLTCGPDVALHPPVRWTFWWRAFSLVPEYDS